MSDSDRPPTPDRLIALLEAPNREAAVSCLDRLGAADTDGDTEDEEDRHRRDSWQSSGRVANVDGGKE
jgi:hypothetical protein